MSLIREYAKSSKKNDQHEKSAENVNENRNPTTANKSEGNDFMFHIRLKTYCCKNTEELIILKRSVVLLAEVRTNSKANGHNLFSHIK